MHGCGPQHTDTCRTPSHSALQHVPTRYTSGAPSMGPTKCGTELAYANGHTLQDLTKHELYPLETNGPTEHKIKPDCGNLLTSGRGPTNLHQPDGLYVLAEPCTHIESCLESIPGHDDFT